MNFDSGAAWAAAQAEEAAATASTDTLKVKARDWRDAEKRLADLGARTDRNARAHAALTIACNTAWRAYVEANRAHKGMTP